MADVISEKRLYSAEGGRYPFALFFFCSLLVVNWSAHAQDVSDRDYARKYDRDAALKISQAAIGHQIGNYTLKDTQGRDVRLHDFAGKPLIISMIFTSCHHICPTTTRHLALAARAAEDALGKDSFQLITVGFDTNNDTPEAMRNFRTEQGIDADNWLFLSGSRESIEELSVDLGFQYFPSPRGFDHLNQISVLDRSGTVYSQVYGMQFELPWLVEPLKEIVFNRPESKGHLIAGMVDRVRLFCTVYNPATGRYEIDNSLFFQSTAGFIIVLLVSLYLWRELRHSRRN